MTLSAHLALCWQLWRRRRWAVLVTGIYVAIVSIVCHQGAAIDWRPSLSLACVPIAFGVLFIVAGFAYPDSDLAGREASFPTDQFLLPARSTTLVYWPMAFGALAISISWLSFCVFILRPLEIKAPVLWPAVMAAAAVTCLQAILWVPLPVPYLRIPLTLVLIPALITAGVQASYRGISEATLVVAFAGMMLLAFAVAVAGVTCARRGELPEWRGLADLKGRRTGTTGSRTTLVPTANAFKGPSYSQDWFEWRTGGIMLPLITAFAFVLLTLPLIWLRELAPLQDAAKAGELGAIHVNLWLRHQMGVLLIPPLLASLIGFGRRAYFTSPREPSLDPFVATRPLPVTAFVAARARVAGLSTLVAWAVVVLFVLGWSLLPAIDGDRSAPLLAILAAHSPPRTVLCLIVTVALLMLWTWKALMQGMWADVSGRNWLSQGAPLAGLILVIGIGLAYLQTGVQPGETDPQFRAVSPWVLELLCMAVTVKLLGALLSAACLTRSRMLPRPRLAILSLTWLVVVGLVFTAFRWITDIGASSSPLASILTAYTLPMCSDGAPAEVRTSAFLLALSIIAIPYSRIALIPLMLTYIRHR